MDTWILKYKVEENEQKKKNDERRKRLGVEEKRTVKGWGENCWQMKLEKTLNT